MTTLTLETMPNHSPTISGRSEFERRANVALEARPLIAIADELLDLLCDDEARLDWIESGIRFRTNRGDDFSVRTPRPILRHLLARFSCLLSERNPTADHSPYGGRGVLPANDGTGRAASIEYGNTQQGVWLTSTPVPVAES